MLVSIYMPTRNRVERLGKAVESALTQTYRDIELIVVNDASTDRTEEYLRQKSKDDSRLRYFNNSEPRGAPASRNKAIMNSKGIFVTGLDDDDEFLPERVGAFVDYWKLLTSKGVQPACIYSQDSCFNGPFRWLSYKRGFVSVTDLFECNHIGNQIFAPRAHFIKVGLFDENLPAWQDLELFIRLLRQFGRAHLLDMPTYVFDATLEADRISSQKEKIRSAFEIVAKKQAAGDASKQQALFLQMFQAHYGFYPNASDWLRFLRFGQLPKGLLRMVRLTFAKRDNHLTPTS